MECSIVWWLMECEGKNTFSPLPTFPPTNLLKLSNFFPFDLEVLLYHGDRSLLTPFFPFLWSINYDRAFWCNKSFTPSFSIWFCLKIWFLFLSLQSWFVHGHMLWAPSRTSERRTASKLISRFNPNAASSWWRTRTLRNTHSSWSLTPSSLVLSYFSKLSHFGDLIAPASDDKLETVCEGCYKTRDISIYAWSLVPNVGHYHWLQDPIHRLPPNSKADHLIHTIQRILNFLQLWTITMA
jgi:hypothetical protein